MKTALKGIIGVAACAVAAVTAYAAVIVNEDGSGFVGKGDVQLAFDWNNSMLQKNAGTVQFRYSEKLKTTWVCLHEVGGVKNPQTLEHSKQRITNVNSKVAYDTRNNKQGAITGFTLTGWGAAQDSSEGNQPGTCPTGQELKEDSIVTEELSAEAFEVKADGYSWTGLTITQ
jgi:hypothetical protein